MKLSERLKQLRKAKGLSQLQLADIVGLSQHAINSYESGRREPNSKAMAMLEQYFNVSGSYLRGEIDEKDVTYVWQDADIMDAVKNGFPTHLQNLLEVINICPDHDQKMVFDILVELRHILLLEDDASRAASLDLLQSTFALSTRFVDVCIRTKQDCEEERILKMKQSCIGGYGEALSAVQKTLV